MRPLRAGDILKAWEIGQSQHPLDRALTILEIAYPDRSREELACLPVGTRDRLLLAARAATAGDRFDGHDACPSCGEAVEFALALADLLAAGSDDAPGQDAVFRFATGEMAIEYRLPTSLDQAAAAGSADIEAARALLVARCIVRASRVGVEVSIDHVPEAVVAAVESELAARDPLADITLDLACPACGHGWSTLFDIGTFFWTELTARARRLLREVDALAYAYGWSEEAILALGPVRRQAYLALVT
jgi:hypothetical protein